MKEKYLEYISAIRRYSPRTCEIYRAALDEYEQYCGEFPASLNLRSVRNYEVWLMDERHESPSTVNLHLSVLSGFCRFLMKEGALSSNPVKLTPRPKQPKRLPAFYREGPVREYFDSTSHDAGQDSFDLLMSLPSGDSTAAFLYNRRLSRLIISVLYGTGLRRSELIGLNCADFDAARASVHVTGKGGKMREIPLLPSLCKEISLYLETAEKMTGRQPDRTSPLLVNLKGNRLYPVYVDRVVKAELGGVEGMNARKSPHVLRHTLATQLLDGGAELNSIKELLGHSSLAATQVYTHNTVERLKSVYNNAHPRAKNGGSND